MTIATEKSAGTSQKGDSQKGMGQTRGTPDSVYKLHGILTHCRTTHMQARSGEQIPSGLAKIKRTELKFLLPCTEADSFQFEFSQFICLSLHHTHKHTHTNSILNSVSKQN